MSGGANVITLKVGQFAKEVIDQINDLIGEDMSDYDVRYEKVGDCYQRTEKTCCDYKMIVDFGSAIFSKTLPPKSQGDGSTLICQETYDVGVRYGSIVLTKSCSIEKNDDVMGLMIFAVPTETEIVDEFDSGERHPEARFPDITICK